MKFDFTPEVKLNNSSLKAYRILQGLLYLSALFFGSFLVFLLLFSTGHFTFSFANFNSTKNTLVDPRDKQGNALEKGKIEEGMSMIIDASISGNFSKAVVSFDLGKKSGKMTDGKVRVKKSFRSYLSPIGEDVGFKDGSLLKYNNNYYIISEGVIRQFANKNLVSSMGYEDGMFVEVLDNDLKFNPTGETIVDGNIYPEDALFRIGEDYFILSGGQLEKFISRSAFLSQYRENQAISKDAIFLNSHRVSPDSIGFSDGSLIAYGISAYIVSGKDILPIGSAKTFEADGYSWDDVINVSGDEVAFYSKGKFFSLDSPHPNGTIFLSEANNYYIMKDGQKHFLRSEKAADSWLVKRKPVLVSEESSKKEEECILSPKKIDLGPPTYVCEIPVDSMADFLGKDYEFTISSGDEIDIDRINIVFKKAINWKNLKQSVYTLVGKIFLNYGIQQ